MVHRRKQRTDTLNYKARALYLTKAYIGYIDRQHLHKNGMSFSPLFQSALERPPFRQWRKTIAGGTFDF